MKKVLSIIITVSMMLSCAMLCSCGTTEDVDKKTTETIRLNPYTLYGSKSDSDGGLGVSMQTDVLPEEWTTHRGFYQDDSAPKSITVEVQGQKYTYEYTESFERELLGSHKSGRAYHIYGKQTDKNGFVQIDTQTNEIIAWGKGNSKPAGFWKIDSKNEADLAEVKEIAEEHLKDLVGEERVSQYQFTIEYDQIYFYRYINGHQTNEVVFMSLLADGSLYSYDLFNIGLYDDISDFSFDEEKAENMIREKVKECYQDKQYSIQKTKIQIQMLPNGQMAYNYIITTAFCVKQYEDGSAAWGGETFNFIIPVE